MKKELVTYTCNIPVSEKWLSKNGRVKLVDVSEAVSATLRSVIAGMRHEFFLKASVEEVILSYALKDEDDGLLNGTNTCVRVTVTREIPSFRHVRRTILERTDEDLINELPKNPYEDAVFRFYQMLGLELVKNLDFATDIYVHMYHKNYHEQLRLRVKGCQLNEVRSAYVFRKLMKNPGVEDWR